ncbi:hypothetical protein [Clostridium gasigenes]|uniref:hypothetical protein n=1 Tax=Clostridium gasigenes TaxID=94869 RepID=UPI001C0B8597|nr:hypothetical protein [Clostridium gasigenes]MBU3107152.1 hypothetical protein [Clostridium gasigenes]
MSIIYLFIIIISLLEFLLSGFKFGIAFTLYILISMKLVMIILEKRISPFLVCTRFKKNLSQSISLVLFVKNLFRNNFDLKTGAAKVIYVKELLKYNKNVEKFFKETRINKMSTTTHRIMYKQLCKYENKNIIIIKKIPIKKKKQNKLRKFYYKFSNIILKIDFIGLNSFVKNIKYKQFRDYIKEPIEFCKYEILIKRNNS